MYLYFFDLDDTICNTMSAVNEIKQKYLIEKSNYEDEKEYYLLMEKKLREYGFDKIEPLKNSTIHLLKELIQNSKQDVYYITAREGCDRKASASWLKQHDLWLGEEKLIMDTHGIKGKVINSILNNSKKEFAFLFDDLIDNHKEASTYKKIISCLPM